MAPLDLVLFQVLMTKDILMTMDMTMDPCNDFYQFACGNYNKRVSLPDGEATMDIFTEISKRITSQIRVLLEEPIKHGEPKSPTLAKLHYQACMNVTQLEALGLTPIKELADRYGGLPVVQGDTWKSEKYDWIEMESKIYRDFDVLSVVSLGITIDLKNSSMHILQADQGGVGLGKREYYLDPSNSAFLEAYQQYMIDTALELGADNDTAVHDISDIIDFETRLAKIMVRDEDRRNYTMLNNKMTVGEFKDRYKQLQFGRFFAQLYKYGWKLNDTQDIVVFGDLFLTRLPEVLGNTSNRTLANHQLFGVIGAFLSYLPPKLQDNYRKYRLATTGIKKDQDRWEDCVGHVQGDLGFIVSSMYIRKFFKPEAKEKAEDMVRNIRASMNDTIKRFDWMDDKTKSSALFKLSKMLSQIGYPAYIFNETLLLQDMEEVQFTADGFMKNAIQLATGCCHSKTRQVQEPVDRTHWQLAADDVNGQNLLDFNSITFPAGILQYPLFSTLAPVYFNYARIGSIIGHEITHGFDDEGRQFSGDGGIRSWWSGSTSETFSNGTKCFIEQYGSITDNSTGLKLNGDNTVGENIADNGGIKLAYKAFKMENKETAKKHIGNYSNDQLFFIAHAQVWCSITREQTLKRLIIEDSHPPGRYRVNVPLKNFDAFAHAFKCSPGSPMNPIHKCSIW